jgi:hypothetical protein
MRLASPFAPTALLILVQVLATGLWLGATPAAADGMPAAADSAAKPADSATAPAAETPATPPAATPEKQSDAKPAVRRVRHGGATYRAYRPSDRRGGYALYTRPYRMYWAGGHETGNQIGFQSLDFNTPGTELYSRGGYRGISPRQAGYVGLHCGSRPVPDPVDGPWISPFDFDCY